MGIQAHLETIVAPITALRGAVALVRLSGDSAWEIAAKVFSDWPAEPEPRKAYYGNFVYDDDGLCIPFQKGGSYTGEESVEFSVHGSAESVRQLVETCLKAGARNAQPGEFTQRAFLNGRLDLSQAEAVRDTVEAETEAQLKMANLQRKGSLKTALHEITDLTVKLIAAVEASVDFSEEVGELDRDFAKQTLGQVQENVQKLIQEARVGRIVRHGYRVAIIGPPNAGKSSLLNALLETDRVIVTETPGTTRDFVEEQIDINGLPVVLIDTAGLREAEDEAESIGIQRSRAQAGTADEIWYVYDAALGWTEQDKQNVQGLSVPLKIIANKIDLCPNGHRGQPISALRGTGIQELQQDLWNRVLSGSDLAVAINERHLPILEQIAQAVQEAQETLLNNRPDDLLVVLLQDIVRMAGLITGETADADILERIFRDFCIGK